MPTHAEKPVYTSNTAFVICRFTSKEEGIIGVVRFYLGSLILRSYLKTDNTFLSLLRLTYKYILQRKDLKLNREKGRL